jgi:hypothetical protein
MPPSEGPATAPILDGASNASWQRAVLGFLLTPLVLGLAGAVLPRVQVGEQSASMIVYAGAASTALVALAVLAGSYPPWKWRVAAATVAACAIAAFAWGAAVGMAAPIAINAALVVAAWAIGTSIGRRIEHPGHLLPACVVVAAADATSIASQWGPTHALAESEVALSLFAVGFPVPGTSAFAPALGVGDLIFMAIVFGAVAAHRLSVARAALFCALGTAVAGAASAALETAVPALVPIAAAVVLGIPEARRVRPRDRRAATLAMIVAASVAAAVIGSRLVYLTGM